MDYATARYKIAQQQLRQWKKNRGTSMDCSINNQRSVKIADRINARVIENRERMMETITELRRNMKRIRLTVRKQTT